MNQNATESRQIRLTGDHVGELALLSEYQFDLERALRALDRAERMSDLESDASDYLIDFAVLAYWLSFSRSDSRPSLSSDDVPEALHPTHAFVHRYRNRVLAHADAQWVDVAGFSIVDRVDGTFSLREPILGTARPNLPAHFVRDLRALIIGMSELVQSRIDVVRRELVNSLSQSQLKELWNAGSEIVRYPEPPEG